MACRWVEISKVLSIFFITAICIGIIGLYMNSVDENVQSYLTTETTKFVDTARAKGEITVEALMEFNSAKATAGDFVYEIHVEKKYFYPQMDAAGNLTGETVTAYDYVTQADILNYMFNTPAGEQSYPLETGDMIFVEIKRSGQGFTGIANLFGMGGKEGNIIFNYSGTVYHSGLFAFYYLDTKATRALDETTEELTKTLSEAMYDVATGSDWDFDSEMSRKTFITNFTNRLSASLGYDATEDTKEAMMQKVPAIILAGNSCFYIYYTGTYNSGGVTYVSKAFSPRIPYTDVYGNYAVSFSFDGQIKVEVNGSADVYQGLYYDVYAQLGSPAVLNFMATEKDYVTTVSLLATRLIEQNFEMRADKGLIGENSDKSYVFSIPAGETGFLRTVTGPCAIAMYQGNTMQITTGEMINAYSFVAADLQQRGSYVVLLETNPTDGSTFLTYHREGCTHSGSRIMKGTMQECAGHGAYPCPDCIVCK